MPVPAAAPKLAAPTTTTTESTPLLSMNGVESSDIETGLQRKAQLQQQEQVESRRLDHAIEFNGELIEERDQGIAEIQRQIGEVS